MSDNLFGGIFKNFSFDGESINNLINLKIIHYNHNFILGENFYLNEIKTRTIKKKLIKQLFSYNGYWSDKEVFFPNDEDYENEENKLKSSKLNFKLMNFVTNDLKKPLLTPILDINNYIKNFKNDEIDEQINNDFYQKFAWFSKTYNKEKEL